MMRTMRVQYALVMLVMLHAVVRTHAQTPPPPYNATETIDFGQLLRDSPYYWSLIPNSPPFPPPPAISSSSPTASTPVAAPPPSPPVLSPPWWQGEGDDAAAPVLLAITYDDSATSGCDDRHVLHDALHSLLALELAPDVHLTSATYPTDLYEQLPSCRYTLLPVQVGTLMVHGFVHVLSSGPLSSNAGCPSVSVLLSR
jgi:hypothetical protein